MNSRYNSLNFIELRDKILLINSNSIFNKNYEFVPEDVIKVFLPVEETFYGLALWG